MVTRSLSSVVQCLTEDLNKTTMTGSSHETDLFCGLVSCRTPEKTRQLSVAVTRQLFSVVQFLAEDLNNTIMIGNSQERAFLQTSVLQNAGKATTQNSHKTARFCGLVSCRTLEQDYQWEVMGQLFAQVWRLAEHQNKSCDSCFLRLASCRTPEQVV